MRTDRINIACFVGMLAVAVLIGVLGIKAVDRNYKQAQTIGGNEITISYLQGEVWRYRDIVEEEGGLRDFCRDVALECRKGG